MRKSKVYRIASGLLSVVFLALFVFGLVLTYRFFYVVLPSATPNTQGVGQIALVCFGLWWLMNAIDELDAAEDKALDAEYQQLVYSGLLARGKDESNE